MSNLFGSTTSHSPSLHFATGVISNKNVLLLLPHCCLAWELFFKKFSLHCQYKTTFFLKSVNMAEILMTYTYCNCECGTFTIMGCQHCCWLTNLVISLSFLRQRNHSFGLDDHISTHQLSSNFQSFDLIGVWHIDIMSFMIWVCLATYFQSWYLWPLDVNEWVCRVVFSSTSGIVLFRELSLCIKRKIPYTLSNFQ